MVEQFGFAMMPLGRFFAASMLTSGTTSGTSGSMRQALELSITTAPDFAAIGPNSRDTLAPALKSAMSTPSNDLGPSSSIVISPPFHGSLLPALRLLASATRRETGKSRCSRVLSISRPTAPVAPAMATTKERGGDILSEYRSWALLASFSVPRHHPSHGDGAC